jgi:hypothetical protein
MFTLNNIRKTDDLSGYYVDSHPCPICGDALTIYLSSSEVFHYHQGGYAQDVISRVPPAWRERFISGICEDCWNLED